MNFLFSPKGRIGRLAWWLGQLVPLVAMLVFYVLIAVVLGATGGGAPGMGVVLMVLLLSFPFAGAYINICLTVKRYHDRDKSGWWVLIAFVPIVGPIWQLVECGFLAGSPGVNGFGAPGGGAGSMGRALETEFAAIGGDFKAGAEAFAGQTAATVPTYRPTGPVAGNPAGFGRRGA